MKYLAKVWTSALTFGALMLAGSTGASAHRVNNNQHVNNPQNQHQSTTKVVNPNQQKQNNNHSVYPLYHFRNDQNQFRLGAISKPHYQVGNHQVTRHQVRRYFLRQRVNHFKIGHHHLTKRNSSYSRNDKLNPTKAVKNVNGVKPVKVHKHHHHKAVAPQTVNPTVNTAKSDNANATKFANTNLDKLANTKLGDPYVWGATGANAFDCSGFTQYLYKNAKHINLPRTAQEQYNYGKHVNYNSIKPGNLVFFGYAPSAISHVGMYVGNGKMIDAQNRGVVIENVLAPWWNLVGCADVD